jgi:hypothetical protein
MINEMIHTMMLAVVLSPLPETLTMMMLTMMLTMTMNKYHHQNSERLARPSKFVRFLSTCEIDCPNDMFPPVPIGLLPVQATGSAIILA